MKATEAKLLEFLKKSSQFVIPIYQRMYSWTTKESKQLWDDVIRTGCDDAISVHFVGSIVYIEAGQGSVTLQSPLLVIDGQQRLTTLTLLLAALANALEAREEKDQEPVDGFSPRKLRNYYLLNPEEKGEKHYKLILSQTDKASLIAVVEQGDAPSEASLRISQNYELFRDLIADHQDDFVPLCKGLAKLVVVDVALNRDLDNPQLIFESMNSTGRKLSQADLIRNFILMGLDPEVQTKLYEQYWRRMELEFGQEAYGVNFDGFMRHYLTLKNAGEIPKLDEVYEKFKLYSQPHIETPSGVEGVVKDIRNFAKYYCSMALGKEPDADLRSAFNDLRELKVDVAYPFLLELYDDYAQSRLTNPEFAKAVRLTESYVFRRSVCSITPNSMNKTFANFTKALDKAEYLESVREHFRSLPSYRRFPTDDEFRRELPLRDLYNIPRRSYWLRRLENFGRKELVSLEEYTVEHILPQNPNLSAKWKAELGLEWQRIQGIWLHTLGNLTLTKYNSEYSDRPFSEKQNMDGGFAKSPLNLNVGLGQVEQWNEGAISSRASRLAEIAVRVWPAPPCDPTNVIPATKQLVSKAYSIQNHPRLLSGTPQILFDALSKEVLALDPCVTQEFFKQYIAFKAERNFVDVEPRAKGLLLTFNLEFAETRDPKGLCKDVTNLGHQGNGDAQLGFATLEELPYVMGLVRQSFESQMGTAADG